MTPTVQSAFLRLFVHLSIVLTRTSRVRHLCFVRLALAEFYQALKKLKEAKRKKKIKHLNDHIIGLNFMCELPRDRAHLEGNKRTGVNLATCRVSNARRFYLHCILTKEPVHRVVSFQSSCVAFSTMDHAAFVTSILFYNQ